MHKVILVVGDVESVMEPFNEELEVEPWYNEPLHENTKEEYLQYILDKDPTSVIKTFKELVEEYGVKDYTGSDEWRLNKDIWEVWSTYNQSGMWDWYERGGRWKDNITNISGGTCDRIDKKNYKSHEMCGAIVINTEWYDEDNTENFKEKVKELISELDDSEWITTVDIHF